jgi:hypothetical protein
MQNKTKTVHWEVSPQAEAWMQNLSKELGESTATILDLLIQNYEEQANED